MKLVTFEPKNPVANQSSCVHRYFSLTHQLMWAKIFGKFSDQNPGVFLGLW